MTHRPRFSIVLAAGLACAGAATTCYPSPSLAKAGTPQHQEAMATPAPVVAAERAFAADGLAMGVDRSFLAHSTANAILLNNAPVLAHTVLDPDAVVDEAAPKLVWFPLWAGISRSGDLGFTTGPVEVGGRRRGHYFTIWQKQPDGGWKWVYDGGVGASSAGEPDASTEPTHLAVADAGAGSAANAISEVGAAELAFAGAASTDSVSAHLAVLADDARLYVAPLPPARGRAAFAEALQGAPGQVQFGAPMGGGASDAGDLAWVYGTAGWTHNDVAARGHYVRVWQRQAAGWKVVFAQVVPARP